MAITNAERRANREKRLGGGAPAKEENKEVPVDDPEVDVADDSADADDGADVEEASSDVEEVEAETEEETKSEEDQDFEEMSVTELKDLASEHDIPGRSGMNKAELVEALEAIE